MIWTIQSYKGHSLRPTLYLPSLSEALASVLYFVGQIYNNMNMLGYVITLVFFSCSKTSFAVRGYKNASDFMADFEEQTK